MSTTVIVPVLCDEHEVTYIPTPRVGLHCWDCEVTYWAEEE